MIAYIGLGSNLGNRLQNMEWAVEEIKKTGISVLKISPVYETAALLPPMAMKSWNRPFLNAVVKVECGQQTPQQLLLSLKVIEKSIGRKNKARWAPRIIDLDILLFGGEVINIPELKIPHPELIYRDFVLVPLKELDPSLKIPVGCYEGFSPEKNNRESHTALEYFRRLKSKLPTWMHILNVTPDSFSDGGELHLKPNGFIVPHLKETLSSEKSNRLLEKASQSGMSHFVFVLQKISDQNIHIVDLGAESTRPGAVFIAPKEEWQRLEPYIKVFFDFYKNKIFRPKLSIDTRHVQTAKKALDMGADIINDVSGLSAEMLELLKDKKGEYVLMHSLTVPADVGKTLPINKDPLDEIKKWLEEKVNILEKRNISLDRIIFDPGIGFGKTADQSLEILKRIQEFYCFPLRIMVGHSRKSFMKRFSSNDPKERDPESAGISISLMEKGVDILRVHKADFHARVLRGFFA